MLVESSSSFHCRVVLIGDSSVGKTCILNRLIDQTFQEHEPNTIGANYQLYVEDIDGTKIEIQIWDTAGQEKFRSLGPIYFRNSVGAIIVFDLTNRKTFENLEEWVTAFTEVANTHTIITIVGNKSDLVKERQVPYGEALEWAGEQDYKYFETSAKTGEGVEVLFKNLANELLNNRTAKCKKKQTPRYQHKEESSCC